MGADMMICLECQVKQQLGDGDMLAGTERLLSLKKTREHANNLIEQVREQGGVPAETRVTSVVITADGPSERTHTLAEMLDSTAPLEELIGECQGCPANVFDDSVGCWGHIRYPIARRAEEWLMERVQPGTALGGWLLLRALEDFDYDGATIRTWRERGLLESSEGVSVTLRPEDEPAVEVSSDQILEAVLAMGEPLDPFHCLCVLLWLGALEVDGAVPPSADDPSPLRTLSAASPDERTDVADLSIGSPSDEPGVLAMQKLLVALHRSWVLDAPLFIDA